MNLGSKPYLILFIVLIAGGVTAAYAITITLGGDVSITGALAVIGAITSPTTDTMQTDLTSLDTRVTNLETGCTPSTELCDGIDNDCDTMVDEDFPTLNNICNVGVGVCAAQGFLICDIAQTGTECSVTAGAGSAELCDGLDNNCDGSTDETFPTLGQTCSAGAGVCETPGFIECDGAQTGTQCSATAGSGSTEVCDSLDNNCDGTVDEGFLNAGKYDQDANCGTCGIDCTGISTPNAADTCDSTGTPICVFSCDTGFLDVNGLAVDGCEFTVDSDGIYVSETDGSASDVSGCGSGSISAPCATITFGLGRAVAETKSTVYVADGFYNESITLVAGIDLLGGYEPGTWTRHVSTTLTIIQGNSGDTHKATVTAISITSSTTFDGFIIIGQDNPTPGGNSYGIRILGSDSTLVISNNQIFTGTGGLGTVGSAGTNGANGVAGAAGASGFFTSQDPCTGGNDRQFSNGGVRSCSGDVVNGGNGGGNSCAPVFDTETSGTDGSTGQAGAGGSGGAAGAGGDAGDDARLTNSGSTCDIPSSTRDGADGGVGSDGTSGNGGTGCASPSGSVSSNHWVGGVGFTGTSGGNGGGGGGGGASGGSDSGSGVSDDGLGGHGAGGGSGACGGTLGNGGSLAGGGSFGIIVVGGTIPSISNNEIRLGNGGIGGSGGNAGVGGVGGNGFAAPAAGPFCIDGAVGAGGDGGDGGHGGGGGGACGGVSLGISTFGVGGDLSGLATGNTFVTIGSAGSGGSGGLAFGGSDGTAGQTGTQANVLSS